MVFHGLGSFDGETARLVGSYAAAERVLVSRLIQRVPADLNGLAGTHGGDFKRLPAPFEQTRIVDYAAHNNYLLGS
jgi:hypothetical protein